MKEAHSDQTQSFFCDLKQRPTKEKSDFVKQILNFFCVFWSAMLNIPRFHVRAHSYEQNMLMKGDMHTACRQS